ncbi:MAG: deoxyribodipyrimidine photo-lyase [Anaerolineae bacterium]|nr:deoxyribodipyrimidine photo-lyase [Anaerolineae bacterium]
MKTAIWWVRRDLRLHDNQALAAALASADRVVPLFVYVPALRRSATVGEKRLAFLLDGLRALDADLRAQGSRLIVRRSEDPLAALTGVMAETGASAIYAEADYSGYARARDERVAADLPLHLVDGVVVRRPGAVLKGDGTPYTVFTPFGKAWKQHPLPGRFDVLPAPERIPTPPDLCGDSLPSDLTLPASVPFVAGGAAARAQLAAFVTGDDPPIYRYGALRDRMDLEGTAGLSPYLRFGMISAREAVVAALECMNAAPTQATRESAEVWLNELIWREFFVHILRYFPIVQTQSFRASLRDVAWTHDVDSFAAWCEGRTGYPVVDAAMRQLVQTGWMHNRARMIVASFLCKDLLIDWRWGERFFMQHLVDGDPAANNGGWQWSAGTGTDAAPYFRIFNPVSQGKKHDPQGEYVRRFLPELAAVPGCYLHAPWEMPQDVQRASGCVVGVDYPHPIVDHSQARARALAAYSQHKGEAPHGYT